MTEADAIKLAERIEFWQERLVGLGLSHWRIHAVRVVGHDDMPSDRRAKAAVQCEPMYDTCDFYFEHDYLAAASEAELDQTIIHEWVHVFMRDFDNAIESIEDALSPGVEQQWGDWVNHEREGVVDRLSRQIYVLYTVGKTASPQKIARVLRASS